LKITWAGGAVILLLRTFSLNYYFSADGKHVSVLSLSVGQQKGHPACKKLGVDLLVVTI